jgi:hypothetical protein
MTTLTKLARLIDERSANSFDFQRDSGDYKRFTYALLDVVMEMEKALAYYASGAKPSENYPRNEFGCGCCAGHSEKDSDGDWEISRSRDEKAQGLTAREALAYAEERLKSL